MTFHLFNRKPKADQDYDELTDEQLAARYQDSLNPEWVGILFTRYTHLLFAVCYKYLHDREDAQDAVMQVFEKLLKLLKTEEVRYFKGYIYTLARNTCLMQLRHQKIISRFNEESLKESETEDVENVIPGHLLFGEEGPEDKKILDDSIARLNPLQARCIRLFYLEDKTYLEIADLTGFSLKEIKSHLQNGRRNLKIYLEKAGLP